VEPVASSIDAQPVNALGRAVLRRWPVALLVAVVAVVAAGITVADRSASYEASAKLLVSPLAQYDVTFLGTSLLRDPGDPKLTASTAAEVLHTGSVAREAVRRLGDGTSSGSVLDAVRVVPAGETNVLRVTAHADDPARAVHLATVFARSAVLSRWPKIASQLHRRIAILTQRSRALKGRNSDTALADQLRALRIVRAGGRDPTLSVAQGAGPAVASARTSGAVVLVLALLGGGFLGVLAAIGIDRIDRRVRDEDDALEVYALPVWARVPRARRRLRGTGPIAPSAMTPAGRGAFRAFAVQIDRWAPEGGSIALISSSDADGRTTAAVNVTAALVERGRSAALVRLGEAPGETVNADLDASGVPILEADGDKARPLAELLEDARKRSDIVVIDGPPLSRGADMAGTAMSADLVLVVRVGHTLRRQMRQVRDVLEGLGVRPAGLVLVGVASRGRGSRERATAATSESSLTAPALTAPDAGALGASWETSPRA
jgi:Mrp family chromosome partitioning ATPase/capsular polysaccharide biosynthesis protein